MQPEKTQDLSKVYYGRIGAECWIIAAPSLGISPPAGVPLFPGREQTRLLMLVHAPALELAGKKIAGKSVHGRLPQASCEGSTGPAYRHVVELTARSQRTDEQGDGVCARAPNPLSPGVVRVTASTTVVVQGALLTALL